MKRFTTCIAVVVLIGCSQAPEDSEALPSPEVAGFEAVPGTYGVGDETTIYAKTRLAADGTYVDMDDSGPVDKGTWRADGATMCFDPEGDGEDRQERCWINGPPDADGSFLSTRDDGSQSYRVTPISE